MSRSVEVDSKRDYDPPTVEVRHPTDSRRSLLLTPESRSPSPAVVYQGKSRRRRRRVSAPLVGGAYTPHPSDKEPVPYRTNPNYSVGALSEVQRKTLVGLGCSEFKDGVAHAHPILAWCRRMAEHEAYIKCRSLGPPLSRIVDICGAMARHARFGRDSVHSTRPPHTSGDLVAVAEARANGAMRFCTCGWDVSCNACDRPVVTMSVDVLYYLSPYQLAHVMLNSQTQIHVGVVHSFMDSNLYDEAYCEYGSHPEFVKMRIEGNGEYEHLVPHWIYDGGDSVTVDINGISRVKHIRTYVHRQIGPMLVVVFTIGDEDAPKRPLFRPRVSELWDRDGNPEKLMRFISATHRTGPSAVTLRQFKSRLVTLATQTGYNVHHDMFVKWSASEYFYEVSKEYVGVVAWLTTKFGFSNIEMAERLSGGDLSWKSWFYAMSYRIPSWFGPLVAGAALGALWVWSRPKKPLAGFGATFAFGALALRATCVGDRDDPKDPSTSYEDQGIPDRCMPQFGARQVGFYFPFSQPAIMASCVHNQKAAVLLRAINPAPGVDLLAWREAGRFIESVPELEIDTNVGAWLAKYPGARRRQLESAIHTTSIWGLERADYHKSRGFVKREFYLEKERDKPRLIQARTDPYLVELGPWVWAYQKALAAEFNYRNDLFYVCGSSAEEIGQWVEDCSGMHLYECDHSAFDSSVSSAALEFEFSCYRKSNPPDEIWQLLLGQRYTNGSTSGRIRYRFNGRRNSGVPNTSVGNSLINMAALVYGFSGHRVRIMVLGDDSVIASDTLVDVDRVTFRLARLGFNSKLVYRPIVYDLEFCSALFWPTQDGLVLGPKPGRVLAKSYWDKEQRSRSKHKAWLRGVFQSQLRDTMFVPVLNKCVQFGMVALGDGPVINRLTDHRVHSEKEHHPTAETYAMFKYRYGLGPEDFEPKGWELGGHVWEVLCNVDNGSNVSEERVQGLTLSIFDNPMMLKSQLYTVLAAPVIEETVKRAVSPSWWAGALFGLVEGLLYGDLPFRVVAHALLSLMPMPAAVLAHVAWNAYAVSGITNSTPSPQDTPTLSMANNKPKNKKKAVYKPKGQQRNQGQAVHPPAVRAIGRAQPRRSIVSARANSLTKEVADYMRLCINPTMPITARIPDDSNAPSTALKVVTRFSLLVADRANVVVSPATPFRLYSATNGAMSDPVNPIEPCANYASLIAWFERARVVSASVEVVQNYSANQSPGIGYCAHIMAGTPLMAADVIQSSPVAHVEPLFNGCFMRYVQSVNPVTGRGQYIDLETPDQFLDRMQLTIVGASASLKYDIVITCNYELIAGPLQMGAALSSPPPVAKQAAETVAQVVGKLPTNSTRDYLMENKATSSLGSKLMDAAGEVAAGLVDSILPKPFAGIVKGLGSAIAGLF